jgi:hypothetical protein
MNFLLDTQALLWFLHGQPIPGRGHGCGATPVPGTSRT